MEQKTKTHFILHGNKLIAKVDFMNNETECNLHTGLLSDSYYVVRSL